MKPVTRLLSLFLSIVMVLSLITVPVSAASAPYETVKADVPIWSQANSSSTKVRTVKRAGTVLTVVSSTTNSHGNLWYKLDDGNWVFSGNVKKHTHVAVACSMAKTSYEKKSASEHYLVSKYDDICSCGAVVKKDITSKTVEAHTFSGGKCTLCQYEWPYKVTAITKTTATVSNSSGANIWNRPYSNNATKIRVASNGAKLTVVAKTVNYYDNTWYQLSDGNWVFGDNVKLQTHTHKASACSVGTVTYQKNNADGHYRIWTYDDLCSCGAVVNKGVTSKTSEAHSFSNSKCSKCGYGCQHDYVGGICSICHYEWPYTVTKITPTAYTVSNSDGAKLWDRPYSKQSVHVKTASKGTILTVAAKTTNEAGNLWYKTDEGYWVFSGNLNTHVHKPIMSVRTNTAYKKNNESTHYVITTYDELCSCGVIYSSGLTKKTEENHTFSGLECSNCHYQKIAEKSYIITYHANGGTGAPGAQGHAANSTSTLSKIAPTRSGYVFLGWSANQKATTATYKAGGHYGKNADITLYAVWSKCSHKYTSAGGDACTVCGALYEATLYKVNKTMYAIKDDVAVRNSPYSGSGYVVDTLDQGESVYISYSFENSLGNPWYRTKNGNYIFAENLSDQVKHVHKQAKTVKGGKTYSHFNVTYHIVTETATAYLCSCGETIRGGEVKTYNERHKSSRNGQCTLCEGSTTEALVTITPTLYSITKDISVFKDLHTGSTVRKLTAGSLVTIVGIQNAASTSFTWGSHSRDAFTTWGKTINGTWIPMKYEFAGATMEKSTIALPPIGVYEVTANSAPLRRIASSSGTTVATLKKGQRVQITKTYYNDAANPWGTTADGYEVYLGNLKYTGSEAQLILNGSILKLSAPLLNEKGNLLIPIRDIAEALGAYVTWNQSTQTAVLQRGLDTVVLQIGNKRIYSDEIKPLNVSAKLINGRTYVPLRALSEMFDAKVGWIDGTKTATVDCPVPTADAIVDDFRQWEFYSFNYYSTFVNERSDFGTALLYVLSNIGEFGEEIVVGAAENVYEAFVNNTLIEPNPLDDYQSKEIKESIKVILSAVPEIEKAAPGVNKFAGDGYDNIKDLVDFIDEGGSIPDYNFKNKHLKSFCKKMAENDVLEKTGYVMDGVKFGADSLEYILTEYQKHLFYLDVVEDACGYSPDAANAIRELRVEYENKIIGMLIKVVEQFEKDVADAALSTIPLYKLSTLLVEGAFNIVGAGEYSKNAFRSATTYIVASDLMRHYSALTSKHFNWSTGNMNPSVKQADWDEVVSCFIVAKAGLLKNYEFMRNASKDSAIKVYLKAQMDVLKSIQIQPNVSKAKTAPYYVK